MYPKLPQRTVHTVMYSTFCCWKSLSQKKSPPLPPTMATWPLCQVNASEWAASIGIDTPKSKNDWRKPYDIKRYLQLDKTIFRERKKRLLACFTWAYNTLPIVPLLAWKMNEWMNEDPLAEPYFWNDTVIINESTYCTALGYESIFTHTSTAYHNPNRK